MEVVISLELPINLHDLSLSDICYNFHVFMRIFTAISLPKEIKDRATQIFQGRLPVPYINTTNLHITLNFFGELIDDEQKKVKEIFPREYSNRQTFQIFYCIAHPQNPLVIFTPQGSEVGRQDEDQEYKIFEEIISTFRFTE